VGDSTDITVKELNETAERNKLKSVLKILGPKYHEEKYRQFYWQISLLIRLNKLLSPCYFRSYELLIANHFNERREFLK